MKRLISLMFLLITLSNNAQVIHWVTFIDTTDPEVGECDRTGRSVLYGHFIDVVNAVLENNGFKPDIHDYHGSHMTPENCNIIIDGLHCDPNDIVVFYYIGHGTHRSGDNNPFPYMTFGLSDTRRHISLDSLHKRLKAKNPALLITIGMCCNSFDRVSAKEGPILNINYGNGYCTETEKKAIQELFFKYRGDIIVTSAEPGQKSYACKTIFGFMDLFTAVLVYNFEIGAAEGELDWISLLSNVQYGVHESRKDKKNKKDQQTPYFEHTLVLTDTSDALDASDTLETTYSSDYKSLMNGFTNLLNAQLSFEQRLLQSDNMLTLFSSDAVIHVTDGIIEQDYTAGEYLGNLATSNINIPPKVNLKSIQKSGKLITELTVEEIY